MKKLLTLAFVAFMAMGAKAQFYVGGSVGVKNVTTSVQSQSESVTAFQISPEAGYTFNRTWAAGLSLSYADMDEVSLFAFSPYARATFAHLGPVDVFAEGNFSFGSTKIDGAEKSTNFWGIGLGPGLKVNVSDKVAFITRTNLVNYVSTGDAPVKTTTVGLNSDVSLGVQISL